MWLAGILVRFLALLQGSAPADQAAFVVLDMDRGKPVEIVLRDGSKSRVELLDRTEVSDSTRGAVRLARVRVRVNGAEMWLGCGNYQLPVSIGGVQVDCAVTRGLLTNSRANPWSLDREARLRVWPGESPLLDPDTFVYPVRQRWFATDTQMANEPSFVDGSEEPGAKRIYYHHGLDIGGAEGLTEVLSATDGSVVVRGRTALPGYAKSPYTEVGYDGVIVLDRRGWFHWYFHLFSIDDGIRLGSRVRMGQPLGVVGKEGSAGCWSHLHYEIRGPQPSGDAGAVEGYGFLWEAYKRQYTPRIIAVARPHAFVRVGETVVLDGSRSWARAGTLRHRWQLSNGTSAEGALVWRAYTLPGTYSEILEVTDSGGHRAYDFAVVQVVESRDASGAGGEERVPPTIHASFWPTFDVRPGQQVLFLVRTCRTTYGKETWDFGDGTSPAEVKSDGCSVEKAKDGYARTQHSFAKPGDYIVRVERANQRGERATAHLWISVGK